ncbi:MAG: rRNA cytosine-C5-methyltransferase [Paludibacteraceae bacterium]|nr:rRNA cytosine-C5-methyltransferase [Paludibacteraceae bacterium]
MQLPQEFKDATATVLNDEFHSFLQSLDTIAPVSIRFNTKIMPTLEDNVVPWCQDAVYLSGRPLFTADPLFHAGAYYVQEASSMFLQQVVNQFFSDAQSVLDLCAAPGGKSTLLAQTLSHDCLLVSNEIVRQRAYVLAENLNKWGRGNVMVTNNEAAAFSKLTHFFDAIVVDAPCSGEGMFRKDKAAINEWSLQNVAMCALRQKDILSDVWDALKPGGVLVYSTCTYNRSENEDNIKWAAAELDAEILLPDTSGFPEIVKTEAGCRFYPHRLRGEGFFISVLRKNNSENRKMPKLQSKKGMKFVKSIELPFALKNPESRYYINDQNYIRAYPKINFDKFMHLNTVLHCIDSGLLVAELKGKDMIPSAQLALSDALDTENCICAEVDKSTALMFLKKENIVLVDYPKAYVLICYQAVPLGWVKNLGTRSNNLYPQSWKIRMNL